MVFTFIGNEFFFLSMTIFVYVFLIIAKKQLGNAHIAFLIIHEKIVHVHVCKGVNVDTNFNVAS